MKIPADFKYPGFYDLLCDAIYQHKLASKSSNSYHLNRHARSSIMASALVIESCSNCLLNSLEVPTKLKEDLDKLGVIAKFETYLNFHQINKLDRGNNKIQKIIELIKLRNEFVHPKVNNIKTEIGKLEDLGDNYSLPMELTGEEWQALKVPKRGLFWSGDSSLKVLTAVSDFLHYVFFELLEKDDQEVQLLLMQRCEFANVCIPTTFDEFESEIENAKKFNVNFGFLISKAASTYEASPAR